MDLRIASVSCEMCFSRGPTLLDQASLSFNGPSSGVIGYVRSNWQHRFLSLVVVDENERQTYGPSIETEVLDQDQG